MASGLRKASGPHGVPGAYSASGTLEGITGPGRRTVSSLELRKLPPGEDLSVLAAFDDLERLELQYLTDVDLAPLAELGLKHLHIRDASGLDLGPLTRMSALERLVLFNFGDCRVSRLVLSSTLRSLTMVNDDPALAGAPVKQAIEAIEWERLHDLRELVIRVGGLQELRPIEVDLGFLRHLPMLERLDMHTGVHHSDPRPSPFEPPFDGLSKRLEFLRIDAWEPAPLKAALRAYLGIEAGPSVYQRHAYERPAPPWSLGEPTNGRWSVYGSLLRAEEGEHDDTEYDACDRAQRRLRAADEVLLKRLDFDPENAGTAIRAASRTDLENALLILDLTP